MVKLKEKLAEEYVKSTPFIIDSPLLLKDYAMAREHFLSGFEKAREMAVGLMSKPAWIAVRDMPKLGEEEVECLK